MSQQDKLESLVQQAAGVLWQGGLVAFPTETVYGLGADARQPEAVARIFAAKGRPSTNPLIVHVADASIARRYVAAWSDRAQQLAEAFWPGPLSLVLPKADAIAPNVTAGGSTVAIRIPNHPLALALLRAFDGPVAAPSANRSNHVSPTTAEHVRHELADQVDLILDGGACVVGIESTVLDLSGDVMRILRPGHITAAQISAITGQRVEQTPGQVVQVQTAAQSPGQQAIHYAPQTPAYRFDPDQRAEVTRWQFHGTGRIAIVSHEPMPQCLSLHAMPADPAAYAHELYATLRKLDELHLEAIAIELPPDQPQWLAVRDRLIRATRPWQEN